MPKPTPRGRPRSQEAHDAILKATIQLLREVGYDALAMDAIATRAGVGKATVYRRWKSKELLVCEALEQLLRTIPVPDTGSTRGDLLELMRVQQGLYADPATGPILSGLVAAMARSERLAKAVRLGFHAARREALVVVLRRGIKRRDLRRSLDLELAMDVFNGPLFYRFLFTGKPLDEALCRGVVDVLLKGLGR